MPRSIILAGAALAVSLAAALPAHAADPAQIAVKAGCMACHAKDKKLFGPPFQDVAAKYRSDPTAPPRLADHVRKGSKGIWTKTLVMIPVPANKISDADLKAVIAWVLKQ
ncbi:MAG: c-type cytochrome [Proteobacteria bacterium]|nr:c-type cytochrome [Pseudomonadota bacterium]